MAHSDEQIDRLVGELAACKAVILWLFSLVPGPEGKRELARLIEDKEEGLTDGFPNFFGAVAMDDKAARTAYTDALSFFAGGLQTLAEADDEEESDT